MSKKIKEISDIMQENFSEYLFSMMKKGVDRMSTSDINSFIAGFAGGLNESGKYKKEVITSAANIALENLGQVALKAKNKK